MIGRSIAPEESVFPRLRSAIPTSASTVKPAAMVSQADGAGGPLTYEPRQPRWTLNDLLVAESVTDSLELILARIKHRTLIYDTWNFKSVDPNGGDFFACNFHGPPGTGKTLCVEALAHGLGVGIVEIIYSGLESKFKGETCKNISQAFRAAKRSNALLFFDEAEGMLGRRLSSVQQAMDHEVNMARLTVLRELDNYRGVIAFATNGFANYDPAIVRRIAHHVEVPLPDSSLRARLWQQKVPLAVPGREVLDFTTLAVASEGLSGADILVAARLGVHRLALKGHGLSLQDALLIEAKSVLRSKQANERSGPVASLKTLPIAEAATLVASECAKSTPQL